MSGVALLNKSRICSMYTDWDRAGSRSFTTSVGIAKVGMYMPEKNEAVIIDTGSRPSEGFIDYLKENRIHVQAVIATHLHWDHYSNHDGIYSLYHCPLYATKPEIDSKYNHLLSPLTPVHEEDSLFINGEEFKIISTPGHSAGHICVVSPDNVCFAGDALMSKLLLDHAKLPYFLNSRQGTLSMEKLRRTDCDFYVIAHAQTVPGNEIGPLIDANIQKEEELFDFIVDMVTEPVELDVLIRRYFEKKDISVSKFKLDSGFPETIEGKVRNLCDEGRLRLEGGIVYPAD